MTLRERFLASETKAGKFLKNWIGKLLLLCSAVGSLTDYAGLIPHDRLPQKVKYIIFIAGAIAFVAGKLTVKQIEKEQSK